MRLNRREFCVSSVCIPFGLGAPPQDTVPLRDIAKNSGLLYGIAVDTGPLAQDPLYRDTLAREAGMFVAEGGMKRRTIEPIPGSYNFAPAQSILAFAKQNDAKMRGHTLVWHDGNPDWLEAALADKPSETILTKYITNVCKHFAGRLHSWDVVNEVIAPDDGAADGMRTSSLWYRAFGENYIDIAFHAAKEADPNALLFFNELNLEGNIGWAEKRRTATLKLLERLKKRNVPIDAVGIQGHLKAFRVDYDETVFSKFLDEIENFGLKTMITEFDIADIEGPHDIVKRDAQVAALAKKFLDVSFSKKSALGCLNWGITDRYSWLSKSPPYIWDDKSLGRVLPYDANFRSKPMRAAMASSFSCARDTT